jgi:hypothetical protein
MIRKRILIGPELPDVGSLRSLVARLGHYFAHVGIEQILIVLAPDLDIDEATDLLIDFVPPEGFDRSVAKDVDRVRESITYLCGTAELLEQAVDCDVLLLWESTAVEREPWNEIVGGYRRNRTMFDVDWQNTRGDGIWFAEAAMVSVTARAACKVSSTRTWSPPDRQPGRRCRSTSPTACASCATRWCSTMS